MKKFTISGKKTSGLFYTCLLLLGLQTAIACEVSENSMGNTIYEDCFDAEDHMHIKMPNLRVKSSYILITPGNITGMEVGFEIENAGQRDTDKPFVFQGNTLEPVNPGFNVKSTVYAVSEDYSTNIHFDTQTSQWMPYSQTTQRVSKLAANEAKQFHFGSPGSPQFYLYDRDLTYKFGIVIEIDERSLTGSTMQGISHGEIIESDEQDNYFNKECLVYGYNISDLSEILHIEHFHVGNDVELPLIGPC